MRITQGALRLLIVALILYGFAMQWSVGKSLNEATEQLKTQVERAENLREENAQLQQSLKDIKEEERWERIARQQLGLVSPGEIVIYNVGD